MAFAPSPHLLGRRRFTRLPRIYFTLAQHEEEIQQGCQFYHLKRNIRITGFSRKVNGGEGTIFGLITGILIIGILNNAMQLASFPDFYQNVVKGTVLLAAVGFDTYQKNKKARETIAKVAV
jgi:hypothetical protein